MMRLNTLPRATTSALQAAGWYPERHIATQQWQEILTQEGYTWSTAAQTFLSHLGGLEIHAIVSEEAVFGSSLFITDPRLVLGERSRAEGIEKLIGEAVCPIGIWDELITVFIAVSGRVFSETSAQILLLGPNPEEAIDVIIRARKFPDLIYGRAWWV